MPWYSLTADIRHEQLELCESFLHDAGANGLEVRDGPGGMPGIRAPNSGEAIVVAFFEKKAQGTKAQKGVEKKFPNARTVLEPVEEKDWSVEWRTRIKSVQVGRLWVGPPWDADKAPKHLVKIVIEPKMAFGTGDHPTTSLCLAAVDAFMAKNPGASVLDVGTGTGVLAFAAKKLGSGRTVATDNDPVAVQLAKEAAEENGIEGIELSTKALTKVTGGFDLVVANILANTLIDLAHLIAPKVGKRLILAGVLVHQGDAVSAAYEGRGLKALPRTEQGEWVRLDFEK